MHYTLIDVLGAFGAFLLFPLVLIIPGYILGHFTNLLRFQSQSFFFRLSLALLISIACCPIVFYLSAKLGGMGTVWSLLAASWICFIILVLNRKVFGEGIGQEFRKHGRFIFVLAVCLAITTFYMVDVVVEGRLVRSLLSYDYTKHTSVTNIISMTGVPPVNPSYYPGQPVELFYYYFWFLICSLVDVLGGSFITARYAVYGSILWGEIALVLTFLLYLKKQGSILGIKSKHYKLGLLLLLVTGFDFIPAISGYLLHNTAGPGGALIPSIEWWNDQISAWISAIVWVPHYIASFVCCMFAFLLINERFTAGDSKNARLILMTVAVLALASSFGMSIWITFTAAVILSVWMVATVWLDRKEELLPLVLLGLSTAIVLAPFIVDLYGAQSLEKSPLAFSVRRFIILERLGFTGVSETLVRLFSLPINYLIELGFFFFGGWLYVSYRKSQGGKLTREEQFLLLMFLVTVVLCTFVKSNVKNNDLGWRGFMFAQFALLLWSIPICMKCLGSKDYPKLVLDKSMRVVLIGMLALGITSNVYEAGVLRIFSFAEHDDYGYALRETYEWVEKSTESDVITQHNPILEIDHFHSLYGNRQVVVSDTTLGQLYGVDREEFFDTFDPILDVFTGVNSLSSVKSVVSDYNIDILIAKRADPVWDQDSSWVWQLEPVFQNEYSRVFDFR